MGDGRLQESNHRGSLHFVGRPPVVSQELRFPLCSIIFLRSSIKTQLPVANDIFSFLTVEAHYDLIL